MTIFTRKTSIFQLNTQILVRKKFEKVKKNLFINAQNNQFVISIFEHLNLFRISCFVFYLALPVFFLAFADTADHNITDIGYIAQL